MKNEIDNTAYPPVFWPSEFAWQNDVTIFQQNPFLLYTWNSIIVSGDVDAGGAPLSAFPPATASRGRGRRAWGLLVLLSRITPGLSYLIPLFILFRALGLTGLCIR